ncbi:MAG: MmcQ/YjbR family DNA-binding protein [Acidimicrobiia bacterium]|nr:MmcQ/YjbR family DNA-binding protein [Acidimicrobiia bacterium]
MSERGDVPATVLAALRSITRGLPESYEEEAWVGTRWRIRARTFAHVLTIEDGWPPAYARASGSAGAACVLTFESAGPELEALTWSGQPFFKPPWRPTVVGMFVGDDVDWDEVAELVTESYRLLAPKHLGAAQP